MNGYPELPTGFEWETDPTVNPMGLDYTEGLAATFGYNDPMDTGVGAWGDNTNDPNAYGVSLPRQTLIDHFGDEDEAQGALVEISNPATGRTTIAPIVDKGPADWVVNRQGPTIDVTEGVRRDLGNTGLDAAQWRIIGKLPEGYTFEAPGTSQTEQAQPAAGAGLPQLPEGFEWESPPQATPSVTPPIIDAVDPNAPYMSKPRDPSAVSRIILHGDVNQDADSLIQYGRQVDPERGFAPGYHFYVARDGTVKQGAPIDRITNHTLGENANSIGIVVAGADEGEMPTPEQEAATKGLIAKLGTDYNIDSQNVMGHGELQPNRRHALEGGHIASDIRTNGYGGPQAPAAPQQLPELPEGFSWEAPQTPQETRQQAATQSRDRLSQDIAQTEKAGYAVPHFIGTPNEPEGDRGPTMDMENLVAALKKQEAATTDKAQAAQIAEKRSYWENVIKTQGMSAEQWKRQTGENDPTYTPSGPQPSGPADTFYKWGQEFTAAKEQYAQTQQAQGKTVDPQKAISHAFQQATTRLSDESAQSIGLKNAKELKNVFKMLPSNIMEVDPATANEWFTEALRNASPELAKTTPPAGFQPEVGLKEQMLTPPTTDLPTMSALEADRLGLQRWRDAESGMEVRRAGQPEVRMAEAAGAPTPAPTPLAAQKYAGKTPQDLEALDWLKTNPVGKEFMRRAEFSDTEALEAIRSNAGAQTIINSVREFESGGKKITQGAEQMLAEAFRDYRNEYKDATPAQAAQAVPQLEALLAKERSQLEAMRAGEGATEAAPERGRFIPGTNYPMPPLPGGPQQTGTNIPGTSYPKPAELGTKEAQSIKDIARMEQQLYFAKEAAQGRTAEPWRGQISRAAGAEAEKIGKQDVERREKYEGFINQAMAEGSGYRGYMVNIGAGLGSTAPSLIAMMSGPGGVTVGTAAMATQEFQGAYDEYKDSMKRRGKPVDPDKAYTYARNKMMEQVPFEAVGNFTEAMILKNIFKEIPAALLRGDNPKLIGKYVAQQLSASVPAEALTEFQQTLSGEIAAEKAGLQAPTTMEQKVVKAGHAAGLGAGQALVIGAAGTTAGVAKATAANATRDARIAEIIQRNQAAMAAGAPAAGATPAAAAPSAAPTTPAAGTPAALAAQKPQPQAAPQIMKDFSQLPEGMGTQPTAPTAPAYTYATPEAEGWWNTADKLQADYFASKPNTPERKAARTALQAHQEAISGTGNKFSRTDAQGNTQSAMNVSLAENVAGRTAPTAATPVAATTPAGAAPTTPAVAATQPTYTPEQEAEVQELMAQYQARGGAFGRGAPVTQPTTPTGAAPKPPGIISQFLGGVRRAVFGKSQFEVSQEAAKRHYKERQILSDQRHRDPALWEAEIEAPMREQAMQSPVVKALGADIEFNPGMDAPMAAAYSPSGKLTLIINPVEMQALENSSGNTGQAFSFYLGEELDHFGEIGWVKDTIYDPAIKAYKDAHAQWVAGGQQGPAPQPKYAELHDAIVENRARLFVDMRHTLEAAPPSEQQALYQAVVDSYNVYFAQSANQPSPGSKGLRATASKADKIFKEIASDPSKNFSSFVAEFTRQARQQRNQGNITESVWRKVLELVKGWFRQSIDRLQQSLPGVQEGKFGADIQRHVQNIEDFLSGKGVEIAPPGAPTTWQKGGAKGLPAPIKNIVNVHNSKGGSTVNAVHGDITFTNAYSVSIFPELGITSPGKKITEKQIADFDAKLRAAGVDTSSPNFSIGTWYDAKSDTTYIDAAITTSDRAQAIALGKQFNQKAIYSLGDMAEIPTGGTGLDPGNLPSIQERLASFTSTGYTTPYATTTTGPTTGQAGPAYEPRAAPEGIPGGREGGPETLGRIQPQGPRGLPKEPQEAGVAKRKKPAPEIIPRLQQAYQAAIARGDVAAARAIAKESEKSTEFVLTDEQQEALAREGEAFRNWYTDFLKELEDFLGPHKEYAPLLRELLAITSVRTDVKSNVTKAVNELLHYVEHGRFSTEFAAHRENLERAVRGERVSGPKVDEFSPALHGDPFTTTMDVHMFRIFFGNSTPTPEKRNLGEDAIRRAAHRLGWNPTQVQAALWGAHLARQGKDVSSDKTYGAQLEKHRQKLEEVFRREAIHGGRGREFARTVARGISERAGAERAHREEAFRRAGEGRGLESKPRAQRPKPESAEAEARRYEAGPAGIPAAATAPAGGPVAPDARITRHIARLFSGAREVFWRSPGLEYVGDAITKQVDIEQAMKGDLGTPLVARGILGGTRRSTAYREFKQYVDTWLDPKKGRAAADALSIGNEAQRLVDNARESIRKMRDHATRLKMTDGPKGEFPAILSNQTMGAIENPAEHRAHWDRLKDDMVRDGLIPKGTPDQIQTNARILAAKVRDDYFSGKDITGKLPTSAYDHGLLMLTRYVNDFAKRASLKEAFGSRAFFAHARTLTTNEETKNYLTIIENHAFGSMSAKGIVGKMTDVASTLASGSQLGNPESTSRNLLGGIAGNVTRFGIGSNINPIHVIRAFAAIKDGKEKGLLLNDFQDAVNQANKLAMTWKQKAHPAALAKWFTGTMLKAGGYNAAETFVRAHGIVQAKALERWSRKQYNKNPKSRASLQFLGLAKRLGFGNPEALIKADGKGPLYDTYLRRIINRVQGGYTYADVTAFLASDEGGFIQKYGKWGSEHINMVVRDVIAPFIRGPMTAVHGMVPERVSRTLGTIPETVQVTNPATGKKETMRVPGEYIPLLRYALVMAAAGQGWEWIAENLLGKKSTYASWAEIGTKLSRGDRQAIGDAMAKTFMPMLGIGFLGALGDRIRSGIEFSSGKRTLDELIVDTPIVGMLKDISNETQDFFDREDYQTREGWMSFADKLATKTWSYYRSVKKVAGVVKEATGFEHDANDAIGWLARESEKTARIQDRAWVRATGRRFDAEMGRVKPRPGEGSGPTEATAIKERLWDHIMLGEVDKAQALIDEQSERFDNPDDRKKFMKGLEASIRNKQPINAAGGGEAGRVLFNRWAEENLPTEERARLERIDQNYRETATQLGLMKGNKHVPESEVRELQESLLRNKERNEADSPWGWTRPVTNPAGEVTMEAMRRIMEGKRSLGELTGAF